MCTWVLNLSVLRALYHFPRQRYHLERSSNDLSLDIPLIQGQMEPKGHYGSGN